MPLDIDNSEVEKIDGEQYEVFLDDLTKELAEEGIDINEFNIVERLDKGEEE